jgi:hypothetical protein
MDWEVRLPLAFDFEISLKAFAELLTHLHQFPIFYIGLYEGEECQLIGLGTSLFVKGFCYSPS